MGFKNFGFNGNCDLDILEFWDLKIYVSHNIGISGFRDLKNLDYSDFGISEFRVKI